MPVVNTNQQPIHTPPFQPKIQRHWHYVNANGCFLKGKNEKASCWGDVTLTKNITAFLQ
jgi:hypothetical protein